MPNEVHLTNLVKYCFSMYKKLELQ